MMSIKPRFDVCREVSERIEEPYGHCIVRNLVVALLTLLLMLAWEVFPTYSSSPNDKSSSCFDVGHTRLHAQLPHVA